MDHQSAAKTNQPDSKKQSASHAKPDVSLPESISPIHQLHQQLGNRVVWRMIQAKSTVSSPDDQLEIEADRTAEQVMSLPDPPADFGENAGVTIVNRAINDNVVYRTPAQARGIISSHTSWGFLDEQAVGRELLQTALRGDLTLVGEVFSELGSTDRDDVAYEFTLAATDPQLVQLSATSEGRRLLDRVFDELTSGSVDATEQQQADRILQVNTRRTVGAGAFDVAATSRRTKIFPFRLPGLTVLNDAPIQARRVQGGIWVHSFVRVLGTEEFRAETSTLPERYFLDGIVLPENEVIGVRLYDQGGIIHYTTPLFLIQLANATNQRTLEKIIEAAGIGLTLGAGALAGLGVEASLAARVLLWADRAAFVLGTVTSVLREHRSWLVEHFGSGFMDAVDIVHSAVAIYGMARVAVEAPRMILALRNSYRAFRQSAQTQAPNFSAAEQTTLWQVTRSTDELIDQVDNIQAARAATADVAGGASRRRPPTGSGEPAQPAIPDRRHVSQIDEYGCGGACGEMAAEHHGVPVTESQLLRQPEFTPRASEESVRALGDAIANRTTGYTGPGLAAALEREATVAGRQWVYQDVLPANAGVSGPLTATEVAQGIVNGLERGNGIFIAKVDGGAHWLVVDGLQGGTVFIRDPAATAPAAIPLATFMRRWLGEAVFALAR